MLCLGVAVGCNGCFMFFDYFFKCENGFNRFAGLYCSLLVGTSVFEIE